MLRMDESNKIYKEFHVNGLNKNEIANKFNRSWATIDKIVGLSPDEIANRSTSRNRAPRVLTAEVAAIIKTLLEEEITLKIPKKQRYRPSYIFNYLVDRELYSGSLRTIRRHVSRLREEISNQGKKSFIQLEFEFGEYLQVDHGPTTLILNGQKIDGFLFVATVPGATLKFCQYYPIKSREAWGDFHEAVFQFFGGIFPNVIYDNDSVLKIPKTGELTNFCLQMQHHYSFKAVFCNKASGWEKGSVENGVGYCRRNYLAGLPEFESLTQVNHYLKDKCGHQIKGGHHYENKRPLKEIYEDLKQKLWPLKNEKIWTIVKEGKVSSQQLVTYKGHRYSVPEQYVGSHVQLLISAIELKVAIKSEIVATHVRSHVKGQDSILLDHYLDQLLAKPRAFDHAKVVKQTQFDHLLQDILRRLQFKMSRKLANRDFIKILRLKRECSGQEYEVALELALESGAINFEGVQSILRQLQCETQSTIEEIESDHIKIDHHFNLNKYSELERSYCYD